MSACRDAPFGDSAVELGFPPGLASNERLHHRSCSHFVVGGYQFTATERAGECSAVAAHLHDLKPTPYDVDGDKWVTRVLVKVRDANGAVVGDVNVTASFGGGKLRTCTTNQYGKCKVKIKTVDTRPKLPMTIVDVDWVGGYEPSANRDTDGDGNGEIVLIRRPF